MTPPVSPCGPLCGPMTGGAESLPLLAGSGRCGPVVGGVAAQGFRRTEGRKEKQDKNRGHRWLFRPVTSPRSAGRYGVLRCIKSGVKNRRQGSHLRSQSPNSYCHNEKIGVMPRKGEVYGQKREIRLLSHPGEESHPGAPVSGGRKPEHDRLH